MTRQRACPCCTMSLCATRIRVTTPLTGATTANSIFMASRTICKWMGSGCWGSFACHSSQACRKVKAAGLESHTRCACRAQAVSMLSHPYFLTPDNVVCLRTSVSPACTAAPALIFRSHTLPLTTALTTSPASKSSSPYGNKQILFE
jgi:hypothetical protein